MDVSTVTQIIGSLGFPIAACVGIAWYVVKIQKQNNDTISKMSDALNNNTVALTKLAEKIDNGKAA
jgi:flagellar biogenesis protein FliO